MRLAAIAFTDAGKAWEEKLGVPVSRGVRAADWAREMFDRADVLLFIGACGIAVRSVAPLLQDKTKDPAVLVMDEAGRHVIPILSGHLGGANAAAKYISELTGAECVLTTATDVRGMTAIDNWALEHNLAIENPGVICSVSSRVLAGKSVGVLITDREISSPFEETLLLRPRTLTLGVGCRKDEPAERFEQNALVFLRECGVSLLAVRVLATIDLKREEPALVTFCEKYRLPLVCYTAEQLKAVQGVFSHSDFVEKTTGVGCVCERAAAADSARLLMGKTIKDGATFALAGDHEDD